MPKSNCAEREHERRAPTADDPRGREGVGRLHGEQQYELFPPDEREGCMRWGLCES